MKLTCQLWLIYRNKICMFIAGCHLIWSTPRFQTGISFFEMASFRLFLVYHLYRVFSVVLTLSTILSLFFYLSWFFILFLFILYTYLLSLRVKFGTPSFREPPSPLYFQPNVPTDSSSTTSQCRVPFYLFVVFVVVLVVFGPLCFCFACLSSFLHE